MSISEFKRASLAMMLAMVFLPWSVSAEEFTQYEIKKLLNAETAPDGVVIELLDWEEDTWSWAAPKIASLRKQLQKRFPDIDIAVVSHGQEQFQLTRAAAEEQPQAIAQLQSLSDEGVNLHVCGTHSSWRDVDASEYIDIVDVSPSGPAQINDYIKLGYTHILLKKL